MFSSAADVSRRLAQNAEAVCRHYLPAGRRNGNYWIVGDVHNTPGRSLFVRIQGPETGIGAVGRWTDASTQEHGDLLDMIALNRGFTIIEAMDEARAFLALPQEAPQSTFQPERSCSSEIARRLLRSGKSLINTHAGAYLLARSITPSREWTALRFHPGVYYREETGGPWQTFPAMLAAITDDKGRITGVHRTWLDPDRPAKANVATPRRALGALAGHGVRFGRPNGILAAGEGIETTLSLVMALPQLPVIAALSAVHLGMLILPRDTKRLYVAVDNDPAGHAGFDQLRARTEGVDVCPLMPAGDDFNADLRAHGAAWLRKHLMQQLVAADIERL
jgi:Toprim domain